MVENIKTGSCKTVLGKVHSKSVESVTQVKRRTSGYANSHVSASASVERDMATTRKNNTTNISNPSVIWIGFVIIACVLLAIMCLIFVLRQRIFKKSEILQSSNSSVCSESVIQIEDIPPAENQLSLIRTSRNDEVTTYNTAFLPFSWNSNSEDPQNMTAERCDTHTQSDEFRRNAAIRIHAENIPRKYHKEFAKRLAQCLGEECDNGKVRPLFRGIIENLRDNELEDIFRIQENTYERVIKCMQLAITRNGRRLTPLYLWEKINELGYQHYTDIINETIEQFSKGQVKR